MKILLTGSTGWIGKNLAIDLIKNGHELICLTRDSANSKENSPFPAIWLSWSDPYPFIENSLLENTDAVIHLMGEPIADKKWTEKKKRSIYDSRIQSTKQLSKIVQKYKIPIFISASAIGYYGDRKDEILIEESVGGQDFLSTVCTDWENALWQNMSTTRCIALRLGVVFGKNAGAIKKMLPAFQAGLGGPIGDGQQWMSWIHIDDIISIVSEALHNEKYQGPINIVSPEPIQQKLFAKALATKMKRPSVIKTPPFILKLLFGDMSSILLSSQRVLPKKLFQLNYQFKYTTLNSVFDNIL